ncbi:hypothetical protein GGTG_13262 [Gaeumannomyces tritici R3-111a-1]|uniref:GED domain-containing protein n=1 Tax=Gaeumannomyces tritici (strain R3-111a-1) TaxID=644352 RepID=J3PID4_GAET3|nr:hypothetical protein GGTG_13262 [Gaeumannomyces tritici R3-111a-1]EJT69153.1 hypothetical protein GGTG_13262 [Gaeumannomyces tritici R3-111a-1]
MRILAPPSIARLCADAAGVVVAGRKEVSKDGSNGSQGAVAAAESKKQAAAVVSHDDQGIATAVAAAANSPQVSASGSTISKDGVASTYPKVFRRYTDDLYPLDTVCNAVEFVCTRPSEPSIVAVIEKVYDNSRGPELGTFGGTVFTAVFQKQSEKAHRPRSDKQGYRPGARLRLTAAPYALQGKRIANHFKAKAHIDNRGNRAVYVTSLEPLAGNKDNAQQVREDILDTLKSCYKVARKRIVDSVCQQVVFHYLLEAPDSPLHVFGTDPIVSLDDAQLEAIAGEDAETAHRRQALAREIESLELGVKILRS